MQGCTATISGVNTTFKFDYINIPILLKGYFAKGWAAKVGVQPGFCINKSATAKYGGKTGSVSLDNYDFKSFDIALPVGVSYETDKLVFGASYSLGLIKLLDGYTSKNAVFSFTVGYKFAL